MSVRRGAPCFLPPFCPVTVHRSGHQPFPFQSSVLGWPGTPRGRESRSFVGRSLQVREGEKNGFTLRSCAKHRDPWGGGCQLGAPQETTESRRGSKLPIKSSTCCPCQIAACSEELAGSRGAAGYGQRPAGPVSRSGESPAPALLVYPS